MTTMLISQSQGGNQRAANEGTTPQMLLAAKNRRDGGCGRGQQVETQLDKVPRYLRGAKEKIKPCRRGVGGSKTALSGAVLKSVERWYRLGSVEGSQGRMLFEAQKVCQSTRKLVSDDALWAPTMRGMLQWGRGGSTK
uniref:Uncharacterized protein n=1 Tax=Photinus pyralis TaxID=7054 RepID=A0A1Y1MSF3_PHOPY